MRMNNVTSNMPANCGMKGMHEGSKAQQIDKNNGKDIAIKEAQKISMEKHKGNHIDFSI